MAILQALKMAEFMRNLPNEYSLYQPIEESQMVLNESAHCLTVQAFMRFNKMDVKIVNKSNAEFMSPSGKVPMIKCGRLCVSNPFEIFKFLKENKTLALEELTETDELDKIAYIDLVENILTPAELYVTWSDKETYTEITIKRYGSPYPWPLAPVLSWRKKHAVLHFLNTIGWQANLKSKTKLLEDVNTCCMSLAQKLGENCFFFGDSPCELDAVVFGHLYSILTTRLPDNRLAETVRKFETLVQFCKRIDQVYFNEKGSHIPSNTSEDSME